MKTKTCSICNRVRSLRQQGWYSNSVCGTCWMKNYRSKNNKSLAAYARDRRKKQPEADRAASRRYSLKHLYGLSELDYDRLLLLQNSKCGICFKDASFFPKPLGVDHCHKTGKIRGLLCSGCNLGLGNFLENPENFISALNYVDTHKLGLINV